eukprot:4146202-Pyramimonas_sp.AAC.1
MNNGGLGGREGRRGPTRSTRWMGKDEVNPRGRLWKGECGYVKDCPRRLRRSRWPPPRARPSCPE